VIRALGAVDARRAAELGHDQHGGLRPRRAHARAQRFQPLVEHAQRIGSRGPWVAWVSQPPSSSAATRGPRGSASSRAADPARVTKPLVPGGGGSSPASTPEEKPRDAQPLGEGRPSSGRTGAAGRARPGHRCPAGACLRGEAADTHRAAQQQRHVDAEREAAPRRAGGLGGHGGERAVQPAIGQPLRRAASRA
jgi:hypothetical protein